MTIGRRIKELREKHGMSQVDLADKISVSKQTLYKYENGIITNIPSDKIESIAKILRASPSYIMGWDNAEASAGDGCFANLKEIPNNILPISTVKVPLIGEIACGEPIEADEEVECYVEPGTPIHCDFALKAKGDSMEGVNLKIHDGDIVFVRKQSTVENGEVAVVIIDNDATLKRVYYYPDDKKLVLQAENSKYAPFVYVGPELETVHILGKAVAFQSYII